MLVNAVSTLEIEVAEGHEYRLERCISDWIARLEILPGCLAYGLTRSARHPKIWLLSGYWDNREAMLAHFATVELNSLIWLLGRQTLGVRFTSCFARMEEAPDED